MAARSASIRPAHRVWREWSLSLAEWAVERDRRAWIREGMGLVLLFLWWSSLGDIRENDTAQIIGESNQAAIIGNGLIASGMLIMAAVCWAPTLVPVFAAPLTKFIDAVYFGDTRQNTPPLNYSVADWFVNEYLWSDAAEEFERISRIHPHEARPYIDGIEAALRASDKEIAGRLQRRAAVFRPDLVESIAAVRRKLAAADS